MSTPDPIALGRIGVVVAARTGSSRLPGKALKSLGGTPMILFLLDRIRSAQEVDQIVFATTTLAEDDRLAEVVEKAGFEVFRGANEDVVARYVAVAAEQNLDTVVRITGDCPFVDAQTLDYVVASARACGDFDLVSTKGAFPVGIDYEIYPARCMEELNHSGDLTADDREHLTLHMYRHPEAFRIVTIEPKPEWKCDTCTFTVDTEADFAFAESVTDQMRGRDFSIGEMVQRICREN